MLFSKIFSRNSIRTTLFGSKLHSNHCLTTESQKELTSDGSQKQHELYGQPTRETHPHLVKDGELVPGVEHSEFKDRRNRLMESIIKSAPNKFHLAVIPSARKQYMTEKIPYVFRQNSDFMYLTGCLEPDSVLLMLGNSSDNYTSLLFVREKDPHSELWDGPRTGVEKAPTFFGVDKALPISELMPYLSSQLKSNSQLALWYDEIDPVNYAVNKTINSLRKESKGEVSCESPRTLIHQMRVIKSPAEQKLMQQSCNIAAQAITKTMSITRPGITEHQLYATVDYESRMMGAEFLAYPPVVAAGNNATIIHYINNTQKTQSGDMVLMDAGCEYHGYASDITRTWPVDGKFTEPQRVLYEIILAVQLELIQLSKKRPPLNNLFHCMCQSLGMKLKEAGVFSKFVSSDSLAKVAYDFCPHHVSHYLGMDVHDTALITRSIPLKQGMVVTIEPGIYISQNNTLARPEFRGVGIRIEDDILITDDGVVVLSANVPKEINDVQKTVSGL